MDFADHLRVLKHNRDLSDQVDAQTRNTIRRARDAERRADALLASLEAHVPRSEWPTPRLPSRSRQVEVEQLPYEALIRQSRHLGRVRTGELLDEDDLATVVSRCQNCQAEFERETQLDELDYLSAGLVGTISGVLDIVLVGDTTAALGRRLFALLGAPEQHDSEATKASFDYVPRQQAGARGNHRSNSLSHHVSLGGFITAVRDVLRGTSTHIIDGEIKTWVNVTKGVASQLRTLYAGHGPVSVALRILEASMIVLRHWWSDVNTPLGLPGPMMMLAKFLEVGSFSFQGEDDLTIADLAHKLYGAGLDLRRFIGDGITVAVNEVLVRFFRFLRAKWEGLSLRDAIRQAISRSGRLRASLLLAHGITSAANAGKVLFLENPLLVNIPQWMAFGRLLMAHLWWTVFDSGAEEDAAHTTAWTDWMRREARTLGALSDRIESLPVLELG
ncbi:MAG: hypothetical protein H6739_29095 [Alphaproteobacteria bacterium]|nr:hypothetical protein [Alphaproteobacteria bacterium]